MAEQVTMWKAEDGSLHDSELGAEQADAEALFNKKLKSYADRWAEAHAHEFDDVSDEFVADIVADFVKDHADELRILLAEAREPWERHKSRKTGRGMLA